MSEQKKQTTQLLKNLKNPTVEAIYKKSWKAFYDVKLNGELSLPIQLNNVCCYAFDKTNMTLFLKLDYENVEDRYIIDFFTEYRDKLADAIQKSDKPIKDLDERFPISHILKPNKKQPNLISVKIKLARINKYNINTCKYINEDKTVITGELLGPYLWNEVSFKDFKAKMIISMGEVWHIDDKVYPTFKCNAIQIKEKIGYYKGPDYKPDRKDAEVNSFASDSD